MSIPWAFASAIPDFGALGSSICPAKLKPYMLLGLLLRFHPICSMP